MKANAVPLLAVFETKTRLEVPLFQRQYVWKREQQWEPLWDDIMRKFTEYLEGRKDAPVHFLGALVLDQKMTPTTHVAKRQVIDGQQRLTTLQIFLAVFRDFCREQSCEELASECETFTINKGMKAEPALDKFKVWPTQLDRMQFATVMDAASREALEKQYPPTRKKYSRKIEPRPRMVEAYLFFHDQISEFFLGAEGDRPIAADVPLPDRLEECFQALKNALQVVAIDLESSDDPQIIFETLNARGEPLLPADLIRNFVFLRAARRGEPQEILYAKYWQRFDDPFWRVEVKQGRLLRPRSDLFMQHFLASRQTVDIPIKHLFVEYKFWVERRQPPFASIEDELGILARQGDHFRRIIEPKSGDPIYQLASFLDSFDLRTSYPLLLAMLDEEVDEADWRAITTILESFLLRRAVCGFTTKNYNRIFLALTRNLRRDGMTPANLSKYLSEQTGESTGWPSDEDFWDAWRSRHVYQTLNNPKVVYILKRLNETYFGSKMETISVEGPLTVEHILPQAWVENWPLPDGGRGLTTEQLWGADADDPRALASRSRYKSLQTFGNLTILSQPLNSTASNGPWVEKKAELRRHSLLPINQPLQDVDLWDESAIDARAAELWRRAVILWPRT